MSIARKHASAAVLSYLVVAWNRHPTAGSGRKLVRRREDCIMSVYDKNMTRTDGNALVAMSIRIVARPEAGQRGVGAPRPEVVDTHSVSGVRSFTRH